MLKKLRRLAELSPGDWLLLFQLWLAALLMLCVLRVLRLGRLTELIIAYARHPGLKRVPLRLGCYPGARVEALVDIASRMAHGQGECLLRSLLLLWLLHIRGERATLVIGVCKESAFLQAHAWIETEDGRIGGSPETIHRFAPLLRL